MTAWSEDVKAAFYQANLAQLQGALLSCMASGACGTAKELSAVMAYQKRNSGYVWFALRNLERSGLVYQPPNYDGDWRKFHRWEITGCGRLAATAPL